MLNKLNLIPNVFLYLIISCSKMVLKQYNKNKQLRDIGIVLSILQILVYLLIYLEKLLIEDNSSEFSAAFLNGVNNHGLSGYPESPVAYKYIMYICTYRYIPYIYTYKSLESYQ